MQMAPEALVEAEEMVDGQGGQQKRNGQARRIDGQQEDAARDRISWLAAMVKTAVRMGPMQGVQPKANAKPSRKPLSELANGPLSARPAFVPPRLRKCRSRLSQRVRLGPARKISDTAISSAGPIRAALGGQRTNPQSDPGGGQDGADDHSHAHRDFHRASQSGAVRTG